MNAITSDLRFAIVPNWVIESELSNTAFRVYALLSTYADNETGAAFPSYATMANRLGWNRRRVRDGVKELQDRGLIDCEPQFVNGRQTSNLYTVRRAPETSEQPVSKTSNSQSKDVESRDDFSTGGVRKNDPSGVRKNTPLELDQYQLDHSTTKNVTSELAVGEPEHDNFSETVRSLTRLFAQLVKQNGHKLPSKGSKSVENWLVSMDRLLRLGPPGEGVEPVDVEELVRVMRWALETSDFWPAVIRSVPNFRDKYSMIAAQCNAQQNKIERRKVADGWVAAWSELTLQMRRVGRYAGRPVLPQLLDEYVDALGGWSKACMTVDASDSTQRAQFRDWYSEQIEKRADTLEIGSVRAASVQPNVSRELDRVAGKDYVVVGDHRN